MTFTIIVIPFAVLAAVAMVLLTYATVVDFFEN